MKHRAWFTLVLRAIGVFFLGSTISYVVSFVSGVVLAVVQGRATPSYDWLAWMVDQLGVLIQAGFGFYLLFGADRLVAYCLASVRDACPSCGCDIRRLKEAQCPECGVSLEAGDRRDSGEPMGV